MDSVRHTNQPVSYERGSDCSGRTQTPSYPSPATSDQESFPYSTPDSMSSMYHYTVPLTTCSSSSSHAAMISPMPSDSWQSHVTTTAPMLPSTSAEAWPSQYPPVPQSPIWGPSYNDFEANGMVDAKPMIDHRLASPQRSSISSHDGMMHSRSGSEGILPTPIKAERDWTTGDQLLYHHPVSMTVSPRNLSAIHAYNQGYGSPEMCHSLMDHPGGLGIRTPMGLASDGRDPYRRKSSARRESASSVGSRRRRTGRTKSIPENATYACEVCGKLFQREYNRKAHMQTHDPRRARPQICLFDGCERSFVRRTDLMRHQESVHVKARPYGCDACDARFSRKDTLQRHVEDGCPRRFDVKGHSHSHSHTHAHAGSR